MATLPLTAAHVDLETGVVRRADRVEQLSLTERRLLAWLHEHDGRVISRDELLRAVWRWRARGPTRAADAAILRLRRKLEAEPDRPDHLYTVHGVGWRFVAAVARPATPAPDTRGARAAVVGALSVVSLVRVEVADDEAGSRLARELRDHAALGTAVVVDLDAASARTLPWRVSTALGVGLVDDADDVGRALASAGPLLLVLDHADEALVQAALSWLPGAPELRVVAIGRGFGPDAIVADVAAPAASPDLATLPPTARAVLARLAAAHGALPLALCVEVAGGAPVAQTARLLVDRGFLGPGPGYRVRPTLRARLAGPPERAAFGAWVLHHTAGALAALRATGLRGPYDELRALLEDLHAAADASAGLDRARAFLLLAEVADALGLGNTHARAIDEAVDAAEHAYAGSADAPPSAVDRTAPAAAVLAEALLSRAALHRAQGADHARADALGVSTPRVLLARGLAARAHRVATFFAGNLLPECQALADLGGAAGRPDVVRLAWADLARTCQWAGDTEGALAALAQLRATCDATGYRAWLAHHGAVDLLARAPHAAAAELDDELDDVVAAATSAAFRPLTTSDWLFVASTLWAFQRDGEVRALLWEARELARRRNDLHGVLAATNNLAFCDWLDGRWSRARQGFTDALRVTSRVPPGPYRAVVLLNLAWLNRDARRLAEGRAAASDWPPLARTLAVTALAVPAPVDEADAAWAHAQAIASVGDLAAALPYLRALQLLDRGERAPGDALLAVPAPRLDLDGRLARSLLARELGRG